jgi:hypothetical protein
MYSTNQTSHHCDSDVTALVLICYHNNQIWVRTNVHLEIFKKKI